MLKMEYVSQQWGLTMYQMATIWLTEAFRLPQDAISQNGWAPLTI